MAVRQKTEAEKRAQAKYDKEHKEGVRQLCDMAKRDGKTDAFSKECPAEDVVKMCCYKGQPYMTAKFLNTGMFSFFWDKYPGL